LKAKKLIMSVTTLCLMCILCNVAYAAPVYITSFADFPAYPYNTTAYKVGGAFVGCGPTTGAMIFGYFAHFFGLAGLLTSPGVGVDEGVNTAWALHSASYMNTGSNGFGSVYDIKPGLENYAADRGYEVKVMAHAATDEDPATSWYNDYGAYGVAWTNDGIFWRHPGGVWDIDPNDFCDFIAPKLSSGICIFLTVDSDGDGGGDHWIPCVGYDKDSGIYYYYNTYDTSLHSAAIDYCGSSGAGLYAISFVRTVEYIPAVGVPPVASFTEDLHTAPVGTTINFDAGNSYDPDGTIVNYAWDFGDGNTIPSGGAGASHAYAAPGTYTVTLTVTDDDGLTSTATDTKTIGPTGVIPEVPIGTILASASMIIAFAAYITVPKWRRKQQ
jgi:PKD repeat protein